MRVQIPRVRITYIVFLVYSTIRFNTYLELHLLTNIGYPRATIVQQYKILYRV